MKYALITILFLFILLLAINSRRPLFGDTLETQTKTLNEIFEQAGICLNVDEQTWKKNIKKYETEWRYFCDTNYFKIHKISLDLDLYDAFLLEAQINHGSTEYDNFIVKKINDKYVILSEFKGYFDSMFVENHSLKFIYTFGQALDNCKALGHFDGNSIVTDTVLSFYKCDTRFDKGHKWE